MASSASLNNRQASPLTLSLRDDRLRHLHARFLGLASEFPGFVHLAARSSDTRLHQTLWRRPILGGSEGNDAGVKAWDQVLLRTKAESTGLHLHADGIPDVFRYSGKQWAGVFGSPADRGEFPILFDLAKHAVLEFATYNLGNGLEPANSVNECFFICSRGRRELTVWTELVYHHVRPEWEHSDPFDILELGCNFFTASALTVERRIQAHWDRPSSESPQSSDRRKLTEQQQKALDYIKAKPGCKALSIAKHLGISVDRVYSGYSPALKEHGVRVSRAGYFPPESEPAPGSAPSGAN